MHSAARGLHGLRRRHSAAMQVALRRTRRRDFVGKPWTTPCWRHVCRGYKPGCLRRLSRYVWPDCGVSAGSGCTAELPTVCLIRIQCVLCCAATRRWCSMTDTRSRFGFAPWKAAASCTCHGIRPLRGFTLASHRPEARRRKHTASVRFGKLDKRHVCAGLGSTTCDYRLLVHA